ncbi:MAG: 6-phosphofructokinase [Mesoaciditoga sp.]|uniref:diphosphate--fructose-6-phosphate 1-phosphotransferase n=1 Tax=Athalassotoga sp. TaxID=2022597 RepID=UPI000CBA0E1D|nr:MAG: 6-phosphofructokinase [Mesoaciditoga sp.]
MRVLVAQSGGPTAVINASLSGVIREAKSLKWEIYGGLYGIEGILQSKITPLEMDDKKLERLEKTPGAYLGSCRYNLPDPPHEVYDKLFEIFKSNKIDAFLYIGGNDSMQTVWKIYKEIERRKSHVKVGGIPKTIDNDLVGTDHCPGFPSAAKFLNVVASEFVIDSNVYSKPSICVIETMGRDSGWLAASLKMAEEIVKGLKVITYIPERPVSEEAILDEVYALKDNPLLVSVSEGIKDKDGQYFYTVGSRDVFGNVKLGGSGERVAGIIEKIGKVKFVNPSFLQRAASHIVSSIDVKEAIMVGFDGVRALQFHNGFFASIERINNDRYESQTKIIPIEEVVGKIRTMPLDFNDEMIKSYVGPLIDELPAYAWR